MSYTIAVAAAVAGTDVATILRAIEAGTLAARKDARGEWRVEPAELDRVYPPAAARGADGDAPPPSSTEDLAEIAAQIEILIRRAGDQLQQQLDAVNHDRDAGADGARHTPPDPRTRRPWWRRIAG